MKQVYQSQDGKIFLTAAECAAHENQNTIIQYYRYTPQGYKDSPVSYLVKITKLYENLCDILFKEFIRNIAGSEITRSFSSYDISTSFTITQAVLSQAYKLEKISANEYLNASNKKELNFNPYTGSLEPNKFINFTDPLKVNKTTTSQTSELFSVPSINASNLNNMISSNYEWYSLCSTPIKALTTDDLKGLNINYIPPLVTENLKSLTNKSTGVFKKTISITDLLY